MSSKTFRLESQETPRSYETWCDEIVRFYDSSTQTRILGEFAQITKFCRQFYETETADIDTVLADLLKSETPEQLVQSTMGFVQQLIAYRCESIAAMTFKQGVMPYLRNYLHYRGIRATGEDYKNLKFPKQAERTAYSLDMEEIRLMMSLSNRDMAAFIAALVSSGMRSGECLQIIKSDMHEIDGRFFIELRADTTKTDKSRLVMLSMEASYLIKERFDAITPQDRVYLPSLKTVDPVIRRNHASQAFLRVAKRAKLVDNKGNHPTLHRFRDFFKKMADEHVTSEWGHRMMGHTRDSDKKEILLTYGTLKNHKEMVKFYARAEPYLCISEVRALEAMTHKKDLERDTEVEALRLTVEQLKRQISEKSI